MKALGKKQPAKESLNRRNYYLRQMPRPETVRASTFFYNPTVVQRVSFCSCDGGCPQCVPVQAKLKISKPNDKYEQEADRIADEVMRMADPECPECEEAGSIQTKPISTQITPLVQREEVTPDEEEELLPECEEENFVQTKQFGSDSEHTNPSLESQIQSMRGHGQPLLQSTREYFEPRFGTDFSSVHIHTSSKAADLTESLNAKAFTLGRDIFFGAGQYYPQSMAGQKLLAHELIHTMQQSGYMQRIMRICHCDQVSGARDPTRREIENNASHPLQPGDWCVTGEATSQYNCIAWSVGNTHRAIWDEVDSIFGDDDNTVSIEDFDRFYTRFGLTPVPGHQRPPRAVIALYARGQTPKHAARRSDFPCSFDAFESKMGVHGFRIVHDPFQLHGGFYGQIVRWYVEGGPTMTLPPRGVISEQSELESLQLPLRRPTRTYRPTMGI